MLIRYKNVSGKISFFNTDQLINISFEKDDMSNVVTIQLSDGLRIIEYLTDDEYNRLQNCLIDIMDD